MARARGYVLKGPALPPHTRVLSLVPALAVGTLGVLLCSVMKRFMPRAVPGQLLAVSKCWNLVPSAKAMTNSLGKFNTRVSAERPAGWD